MADSTLAALTAATAGTGGLFYGTQAGADRKFTITAAGAVLAEAVDAAAQRMAIGMSSGLAGTATALATARTFTISGDMSWVSGLFDGSANVTAVGTLATVNGNVGTFAVATVTVNAKGLVTAVSAASTTGSGNVVLATSPTLTTPRIGTIADTNGLSTLILTATASAVNQVTLANAATGVSPLISATGTDTNIGISFKPKGTGALSFGVSSNPVRVTNNGNVDSIEVFVGNSTGTAIGYAFGASAKSGVICGSGSGIHFTGSSPSAGAYTKGITGATSGDIDINDANLSLLTVGKCLKIKEGTNAALGVATLVAGTVVVNTTKVTANSRIFLSHQTSGGTPGWVGVSARTAGTSFTITGVATDTSEVAWMIVEPA